MKAERISQHVWSLRIWMVIPVRVWVVVEDDGVVLVDAGIGSMTKGILTFIDKLSAGPLKAIILTHGHSDHVGAVNKIIGERSVPVYAHPVEIPYMEGMLAYPRRKKAAASLEARIAVPLPEDAEGTGLAAFGSLKPYLTPGHSPGHVVYYHERDRVLLAGDLFTAKRGKLRPPMKMFTADMKEAIASSAIVSKLKPLHLEICHGSPVLEPALQMDAYLSAYQ
ncbi:MBL fold metallo-hydrolase [Paenibacillus nasutitermitis]|uniref:Metallo-hydrolase YybB n=1 Tax=Paenibacillus nasutitermitis TaxID=1652958 RepID=A0A917DWB8_9BACL|nr:MBL fold metallo-hydrolase [Paenibacillus nasutitermitis]GGD76451.1 putative metallo-hydrolase YybB [Paenibacillus nasutitermitis]